MDFTKMSPTYEHFYRNDVFLFFYETIKKEVIKS